MTHGSLFSGIGGFDLAAEWVGWENKFHCEINEFGITVLKHYWPNAKSYSDIKKTDFTVWRGLIDVLSGGFPCQPYSIAGKRKGKEDDRHLWPEMLRAIREVQPRFVVGENVRGLVNWNGGMVFDEVQADLEAEGYEVTPFLLPASGVNAPHRRDRIWFIAHANSRGFRKHNRIEQDRFQEGTNESEEQREERNEVQWERVWNDAGGIDAKGITTNTNSGERWEGGMHSDGSETPTRYIGSCDTRHSWSNWQDFPTQPPIRNGDDGLPSRLVDITFSKWRSESIKALGNAVVPQVVYQLFQIINQCLSA